MSAAASASAVTRAEIEAFLFEEAALLDSWRLDDWLGLLTEDARYLVPSNDAPDGEPRSTLFTIADDAARIRGRVKRLNSSEAHAESPRSRTRRMISNVRIVERRAEEIVVEANFIVHRFRRNARIGEYVGCYTYRLRPTSSGIRIAERRAVLDCEELGALGSVSFIL